MSWRPHGTVYGVLLNSRREVDALAPRMHEKPYQAPPRAPILYMKTANTFSAEGAWVRTPRPVEIGATVGLVIGAGGTVVHHVLVNDWTLPHANFFRPPVKFKCRDGFLGLGTPVPPVDIAAASIDVLVNGELRQTVRFDALVRPPQQLLADVADFMTLREGDVLLAGCDIARPLAQAGDRVELRGGALGTLTQQLVQEDA